jgi:hypothetical protein
MPMQSKEYWLDKFLLFGKSESKDKNRLLVSINNATTFVKHYNILTKRVERTAYDIHNKKDSYKLLNIEEI